VTRLRERADAEALACALVVAAGVVAIAIVANWREALLALAAAGALAATRIRFAPAVAACLLAMAALLITTRVP
jgi:hypothetical protein